MIYDYELNNLYLLVNNFLKNLINVQTIFVFVNVSIHKERELYIIIYAKNRNMLD